MGHAHRDAWIHRAVTLRRDAGTRRPPQAGDRARNANPSAGFVADGEAGHRPDDAHPQAPLVLWRAFISIV